MSNVFKSSRARLVALAVGAGVMGSFAMSAAPAMASSPGGAGCNPTNGKISGRGSTFQASAISAFVSAYESDQCGVVATQYSGDPAGNTMVAYNYPGNVGTGSGNGQNADECRTDAFGGSDLPYTEAVLHSTMNVKPSTNGVTCTTTNSPFTPASPYPNSADAAAPQMAFPIAGGATAVGYNLGTASCPSGAPTSALNFTAAEIDGIFQGTINQWDDPTLVANNPSLSNCTGAIQRVVRLDNSGTTSQFKTYLGHVDSASTCGTPGTTWNGPATPNLNQSPNTTWPSGCSSPAPPTGTGTSAPDVVKPTATGTPAVINCVESGTGCTIPNSGDGSITYGELGIWTSTAPSATLANLQVPSSEGGTPAYISPGSGSSGSNCSFGSNGGLPGSKTPNDSVSLNGSPKGTGSANWASDAATNKSDFTNQGSNYPICGLTWDFVSSNLHIIGGVSDPFVGFTQNQRETLYTFFSYALTPQGQAGLTNAGYDPLPVLWLSTLRSGYQANF